MYIKHKNNIYNGYHKDKVVTFLTKIILFEDLRNIDPGKTNLEQHHMRASKIHTKSFINSILWLDCLTTLTAE